MQDERPAPAVTISDPADPSRYGDVLASGKERDPWRPGRRTGQAVGAVLAVALLAAGPVLWLDHRRDERRADRQALEELWLDLVPDDTYGDGVLVVNNGPHPVTVVGLGLEGGTLSRENLRVASQERTQIPSAFRGCTDQRVDGSALLLRVRTFRGDEKQFRFDLSGDDADIGATLVEAHNLACGDYGPESALAVGDVLVVVERLDGYVDVSTTVFNRSVHPVVINGFSAPATVAVQAQQRLPLTVPAAQPGFSGDEVRLDLRIKVDDCSAFGETDSAPGEIWAELDAGRAAADYSPSTPLSLGPSYDEAVMELLRRTC